MVRFADSNPTSPEVREVPCVDGSELARAFFTFAALVGAAMCSAFRCGSHDRAPVQFRTWSPILSSCTTPHESTLSPQARRNLPSALRNPLERQRSAIPARGPLEFLDCRRRPQAHQGLTDGAVDVTGAGVRVSAQEPRHAFGESPPQLPVDPATGSPPNSCSCESRVRARLSTACRAWSSIACPPAGIAVTSDCAASASLMTDFANVSTHDGLSRVLVGIKDDISFEPACTPS